LPDSICQLTKLEELYLDDNALEDLPDNIGNLQQLRILSLRNNCLTHLPESLGTIPSLKKLYLASNQLQRQLIPTTLTNKTKSNPVVVNALRRVFKW
jgi:Leucine-rich repeat (LRR) protein